MDPEAQPFMDRKSKKVAALAAQVQEFLTNGDSAGAEDAYKYAFVEAVRLLGLRHTSTRDLLSIYTMCLKGSQKHGEALRLGALYWKTARLRIFLKPMPICLRIGAAKLLGRAASGLWKWTSGHSAVHAFKDYLRSLRQHVLELGK